MWKTIGFRHEDDLTSAVPLRFYFGTFDGGDGYDSATNGRTINTTDPHGIPLDMFVSGISESNSAVTVSSLDPHTFSSGELVTLYDCTPEKLNREWQITNLTSNTFAIAQADQLLPLNYVHSGNPKAARTRVVYTEGDSSAESNRTWAVHIRAESKITFVGAEFITFNGDGTWRSLPPGTERVLLQALDADVHWRDDGTDPTSSDGGGNVLIAGQDPVAYMGDFARLRFIEGPSAGGKLNVTFQRSQGHPY